MFDESELARAVEIQQRSYELLRWVATATGWIISPDRAHEYLSEREAAEAWLIEHFSDFPRYCRPLANSGPELAAFARFFLSYLRVSFEWVADPVDHWVADGSCECSWCLVLIQASHLKPKALGSADKRRAERLKRTYLERLANESSVQIDPKKLDQVQSDKSLAHALALATYGSDLLKRCQGQGRAGPASLALWRQFAYSKSGSPLPKFKLRADDIVRSEQELLAALAD